MRLKVVFLLGLVAVVSCTPTFLHGHNGVGRHHGSKPRVSISGALGFLFKKHRPNPKICDEQTQKSLLSYKKPTNINGVYNLPIDFLKWIGGVIDQKYSGYGSLLTRMSIALSRISVCLSGKHKNVHLCSRDFPQFGVKGCGSNIHDIRTRFNVNNSHKLVLDFINKFTNGLGLKSTKGLVYVIFNIGLDLSKILDDGQNIDQETFSLLIVNVSILMGAFGNGIRTDLGITISYGILKTCHPILVNNGYQGVLTHWKDVKTRIDKCNGSPGPFKPDNNNDDDGDLTNNNNWDVDDEDTDVNTGDNNSDGNVNTGGNSNTGGNINTGSNQNAGGNSNTAIGHGKGKLRITISGALSFIFKIFKPNTDVCDSQTYKSLLVYKKPTDINGVYICIVDFMQGFGGVIDTKYNGYGYLLVRMSIALSRISICLSGKNSHIPFCTRDFPQYNIKGCGTNIQDIRERFRVNNSNKLVIEFINKFTNGQGLNSTKGFVYIMFKFGLDLANILDGKNIDQKSFSTLLINVSILMGGFANGIRSNLGITISYGILKTCHPILINNGYQGVLTHYKDVKTTIKSCNGNPGPFQPTNTNDDDNELTNNDNWVCDDDQNSGEQNSGEENDDTTNVGNKGTGGSNANAETNTNTDSSSNISNYNSNTGKVSSENNANAASNTDTDSSTNTGHDGSNTGGTVTSENNANAASNTNTDSSTNTGHDGSNTGGTVTSENNANAASNTNTDSTTNTGHDGSNTGGTVTSENNANAASNTNTDSTTNTGNDGSNTGGTVTSENNANAESNATGSNYSTSKTDSESSATVNNNNGASNDNNASNNGNYSNGSNGFNNQNNQYSDTNTENNENSESYNTSGSNTNVVNGGTSNTGNNEKDSATNNNNSGSYNNGTNNNNSGSYNSGTNDKNSGSYTTYENCTTLDNDYNGGYDESNSNVQPQSGIIYWEYVPETNESTQQ